MHMTCRTRLRQTVSLRTRPCGTNQGVLRKIIKGDMWASGIMQCTVVIPYWRFGTTYRSPLQGSRNPKEITQHNWSSLTQSFFLGTSSTVKFLKKSRCFRIWLSFHFWAKEHLTWWMVKTLLFLVSHHRNSNLLRYVPENRFIKG